MPEKVNQVDKILADVLNLSEKVDVFSLLVKILDRLLFKKLLKDYGIKVEESETFTDSVIEFQRRLLIIIMYL